MKRYHLLLIPAALALFACLVLGGARCFRAGPSAGARDEVAADYYHRKYQARHWRECVLTH